MASGQGRGSGDIGNDLSSIAAALEDLATRIDATGRAPRGRRGVEGQPSLDRIAAMVEELGREFDEADRAPRRRPARPERGGAPRLGELAATLAGLERDVAALSETAGRGASEPDRHDRLDEIRQRLDALRGIRSNSARSLDPGRAARPLGAAASRSADLDAAIAEISARQTELGRDARHRDAIPRIPPRQAGLRADQLGQIGARLDELVRRLEAAPRRIAAPAARLADDDLRVLAERLAALSAGRDGDGDVLDQLRAGIDDMRRSVEDTARESTLRSIEAGYGHIVQRLDEMARRIPDRTRIDTMAAQLAELREHLAGVGAVGQIDRLEQRIDALAEEIRHSAGGATSDWSAWFSHIESRLGEISQAIADAPVPTAGLDEHWRQHLEDQIAGLAHRLDGLAALQDRPAPVVDAVIAEIAGLRAELVTHSRNEIERLELRIAELADRVAGFGPGDDAALRQLEEEVRLLAHRLEAGGRPPAALAQIEDSLAELQAMVAANRRESIEAARTAAREVASQLAASAPAAAGDSEIVRRLKSELGQLQAAALDSDHRTQEALEAVHDTLKRVVERIADLESRPEDDDEPVELRPTGTDDAVALAADRPTAQAGGWWTSSHAAATEDHRPLEPGSGKPMVGASGAHRTGPELRAADRKADFIAAARRAAQSAAAESAQSDAAGRGDDRPGPLTRISRALRKNKQPLMLAAAALVLTAGIYRYHAPLTEMAGAFIGDARQQAAVVPETLPAELGPAPADDPIRDVLTQSGQLLPESLRNPPTAPPQLSSDTVFAPPAGVDVRFDRAPASPSPSGFAVARDQAPAATDPKTTASIAPFEEASLEAEPAAPQVAPAETAPIPAAEPALPIPQIGPEPLRQAAAAGDPAAQYEVAIRYAEGQEAAQDLAEAAVWYERAATRGLAPAQYRLGSMYERGVGVSRDRNLARLWYAKAAEQGNARAMHNLAVLLSEGVGDKSDYRQALEWFRQAAAYDVRDSQYNLGVIYARGLGTAQDLAESYKWFAIAALGGDKDAAARRDEVAAAMEPGQVAIVQEAVAAWKPTPLIATANTVAMPDGGWGEAPGKAGPASAAGSDLIRQAQALLARRGFDVGPADGLDGPRTREAVIAFQKLAGLSPNGIVDAALIEALNRDSL